MKNPTGIDNTANSINIFLSIFSLIRTQILADILRYFLEIFKILIICVHLRPKMGFYIIYLTQFNKIDQTIKKQKDYSYKDTQTYRPSIDIFIVPHFFYRSKFGFQFLQFT